MSRVNKKICVLGHFGIGKKMHNGQTIKTNNLVYGMEKYLNYEIVKIDSHNWIKNPICLIKKIKKAFKDCEVIIMLPAQNGIKVFSPILLHYKKKYNKKIIYDVIGGWLPSYIKNKKNLSKILKKFDNIFVETNTMKNDLEKQGFNNVEVVPNFKELSPLTKKELIYSNEFPLKLCTFSRVMKEKGIETAVQTIKSVNSKLGYVAFSLDIYGQINEDNQKWFDELKKEFTEYITYKGCVEPSNSVFVLKDYYSLLFPTHFYTEGIPGTIIDAYAAGIPVISVKWESYSDVVNEGKTGVSYEFNNKEKLEELLIEIAKNPQIILDMKQNCIKEANKYLPKNVMEKIKNKIS